MTAAKTIGAGIAVARQDKGVEYPKTVNALKRFNIYPEVQYRRNVTLISFYN